MQPYFQKGFHTTLFFRGVCVQFPFNEDCVQLPCKLIFRGVTHNPNGTLLHRGLNVMNLENSLWILFMIGTVHFTGFWLVQQNSNSLFLKAAPFHFIQGIPSGCCMEGVVYNPHATFFIKKGPFERYVLLLIDWIVQSYTEMSCLPALYLIGVCSGGGSSSIKCILLHNSWENN